MPEATIRLARPTDADAIRACVEAAYARYVPRIGRKPAPMLADHRALIAAGQTHVLEREGRCAAVLVAHPDGAHLFIENIAVDPALQGAGIGRALLGFAAAEARRQGLSALRLYTNEAMTEALGFYLRLGFVETGRRIEDGYRRIYLMKQLDTAEPQTKETRMPASATPATIVPCLRYRDAPAAIEFLCTAFGFGKQLVVPGENGTIAHAQLTLGNGMIMLGSVQDSAFGRLMKQPDEIGGCETQTAYVIVPDADAVYARAKAAGAAIVLDIKDEDYGGRGFTCRDPEGHIWNFGTYDPWRAQQG